MAFETTKERISALNGLGCLVKALVGRELTIDLRNETTLTGTVSEVDGYMNISLENALLEDIDQVRFKYENLYIKGRHIRYIHIPKELTVRETIIAYLLKTGPKRSRQPTTALQRFKAKRLRKEQEETKRKVAEQKLAIEP
ncbi:hypothetical protein V9T40_004300 [Parthenolecanium corni]|uniref:Sm domain-containing protein n=1 Tax=Parthenolecanium corni TaxID=536013 RepID=A0AAN9TSE0_9HEMI